MKYYVVLKGRQTGIYSSREESKRQVDGFLGAVYKSFPNEQSAQFAWKEKEFGQKGQSSSDYLRTVMGKDFERSICTDAACPSNPGPIEYRGVDIETGQELFSYGPYPGGSVNIAEFLAIVEGMRSMMRHIDEAFFRHPERNEVKSKDPVGGNNNRQDVSSPPRCPQHDAAMGQMTKALKNILYSDSKIAISWVIKGKINTQIVSSKSNIILFEKITQAEQWLQDNKHRSQTITLKKWPTSQWGQIPADFGRK